MYHPLAINLRAAFWLLALAAGWAAGIARVQGAEPLRRNLAKFQPVQASSAAAADPAVYATDGIVGNGNRWKSDAAPPHWLSVNFAIPLQVGSAQLYLGRDDIEPVASFALQSWTGSTWITIPGTTVTNNSRNLLNLVFAAPVTTTRIRFYSTEAVVRVREFALFAPAGPDGLPMGTDVTLDLARHRMAVASSVDAGNVAKGAVDGYADDSARWKSAAVNGPHTLEIDLEVSSRLGSAHLYTGSSTGPPISDFNLEAWNGSAWSVLPGGSVVGNTNFELRIPFTSPVATSKIRLNIPGNGSQRVRELAVFAANGAEDFPIGTDVLAGPPPSTRFDTYGDAFQHLVNRSNLRSLVASSAGASLAIVNVASNETSREFQLLYNVESDTYRLRSRDSWLCLAARGSGSTNGTPVAEEPEYRGEPHELWRLEDVGSGYARIVNVASGLVMEADAAAQGTVTLQPAGSATRQQWRIEFAASYPRKGTGGYEGDWAKYGSSWSYNWGRDTGASLPAQVVFSPMQHNRWWPDWGTLPQYYPPWHTSAKPVTVLGFNEPDHADQANMSVADVLALWPKLEACDVPLVSPVAANAFGGWLADFYTQAGALGYRVDYAGVHWYGNPDAAGLINHLQSVYNTWGRPIWLTEFSCVDWGGGATWSEEDNYRFLAEFLWRAEDLPWLRRYAIFLFSGDPTPHPWDRVGARSNMLKSDGSTLTPFGELYASWDGDRALHPRTAYLLHNKSADHRMNNAPGDLLPGAASLGTSGASAQWALVPAPSAGLSHIVSLRDGRRLQWNGSALALARAGESGGSVEWRITHEADGYHFIDHPATAKRLRLNRVDDANGAPTSISYVLEDISTVRDSVRWRLIKPFQPASVTAPPSPPSLSATGGDSRVTLGWPSSPATDVLHYAVYRSLSSNTVPTLLEAYTSSPGYVDSNVVAGTRYYYVVTTIDWIENESTPSRVASASPNPAAGTYANWVASAFVSSPSADSRFEADPDHDGIPNGLEYLFRTDPLSPGTLAGLFNAATDPNGGLLLRYRRNAAALDVVVDIEASPDLSPGSWTVLTPPTLVETKPDGLFNTISLRPPSPRSDHLFYRLRVSVPP